MQSENIENLPEPAKRGRPRDPQLETKVFDAAIAIYGEDGWAGFGFDAIGKVAGVGKNALYRRWPTKGALLRELLQERWVSVDQIDCGNLRSDLLALCHMLFNHLAGPLGRVGMQLQLDLVRHEVVSKAVAGYRDEVNRNARDMVQRAIDRGELSVGISKALLLDVIAGSVMNHVMATPAHLREEMLSRADSYAEQLVALVMTGIAAARPT